MYNVNGETMQIGQIPTLYYSINIRKNAQPHLSQNISLSQPSFDIVSFGSKNKKNNHSAKKPHRNQQLSHQLNTQHSKLRKKITDVSTPNLTETQQKHLARQQARAEKLHAKEVEKLEREHKKAELRSIYLTNSLKESIREKTISDERLNFVISKLREYPELLGELFFEPDGGGIVHQLTDKTAKTLFCSLKDYPTFLKLTTTQDNNGKFFMEKAPLSKIKVINEAYEETYPQMLINMYTTPNKKNQLPAHYLSIEGLQGMNNALKNYPAILSHIYTSTDKNGNTPAHNRFKKGMATIRDGLKHQPETLNRISKIKNNDGKHCDYQLKAALQYRGPYKATWQYIVDNY